MPRRTSRRAAAPAAALAILAFCTACTSGSVSSDMTPVGQGSRQPGAPAGACTAPPPAVASAMVNRVNAERRAAGVAPLRADPRLHAAAQVHACDMARNGSFTHRGADGSMPSRRAAAQGYRSCLTAENISFGWRDANSAMNDLMTSSDHRFNLLHSDMRDVGIGQVQTADGTGPYWVQVFARPC